MVYLIFSVRIPRNQCSFLKHCCPEPPSLLDSRVGVKYLSIYKATFTAVVQCRFHTQPQRWGRVGQKEKLRPSKRYARNARRVSVPERLFLLPWTRLTRGPLDQLAGCCSPLGSHFHHQIVDYIVRKMSPEGQEARGAWLSESRLLTFLASTSSLSPALSKAVTLSSWGCHG